VSDYLWAKLIWVIVLGIAAFIAGLMGWLPGQRGRESKKSHRRG
jgi:hypothetical protein